MQALRRVFTDTISLRRPVHRPRHAAPYSPGGPGAARPDQPRSHLRGVRAHLDQGSLRPRTSTRFWGAGMPCTCNACSHWVDRSEPHLLCLLICEQLRCARRAVRWRGVKARCDAGPRGVDAVVGEAAPVHGVVGGPAVWRQQEVCCHVGGRRDGGACRGGSALAGPRRRVFWWRTVAWLEVEMACTTAGHWCQKVKERKGALNSPAGQAECQCCEHDSIESWE